MKRKLIPVLILALLFVWIYLPLLSSSQPAATATPVVCTIYFGTPGPQFCPARTPEPGEILPTAAPTWAGPWRGE